MEKFLSFAIVKDNSEQYLLVRYADGTFRVVPSRQKNCHKMLQ